MRELVFGHTIEALVKTGLSYVTVAGLHAVSNDYLPANVRQGYNSSKVV